MRRSYWQVVCWQSWWDTRYYGLKAHRLARWTFTGQLPKERMN